MSGLTSSVADAFSLSPNVLPPAVGLDSTEAARRLRRCGPNLLAPKRRHACLAQFWARLRNPLVLILLAASGVMAALGDGQGALIIDLIVLMSVALDFVQEYRAQDAVERLARRVAITATVLRDGRPIERPVAEIVPGDVVWLAAGDLVPADGELLVARDLFVNQASLTGEPYPVEKHVGQDGEGSRLYLGSSVISGMGWMRVTATGAATTLGEIAKRLQQPAPPTAFERGTRQFGLLIMRLTVLLVLLTLLVNVVLHRPWLDTFLFAVALAVGLTPELLPMVVSVTLARGALRMARQRVIVKRLAAIQDMGAMDVLCTDKTGTLTEARIRLERHVDGRGEESSRALTLAYLNSIFESGLKSPLDEAILSHREIDVAGWRKIDEAPFDFERRRVSVLVEKGGERYLIVKGAPEDILQLSTAWENAAGEIHPFDDEAHEKSQTLFAALGDEGFRVLAIAWRRVPPDHPHAVVTDETELIFAGFAAFFDPPKADAGAAIARLAESGVRLKILTGDNERVTQHVCRALGLTLRGVLAGHEIERMDDAALAARVEDVDLFCRLTPAQKNRVILALKARGHTVGYLGDGINDAAALAAADVGISVDDAVDVAKQAADLVMLSPRLAVLHEAVREGRRTHGNVMKYILMATSSNFGNMFSMAAATLFLPFLPMLPMQILLNNLLYDVSEIPLPLDRVDEEVLARPTRWDMDEIRNFMLAVGPLSSLFDFLTFYLLLAVFAAEAALFQTGWFVESVATQVLVIFVIRSRRPSWNSRPHPALLVTALTVVAIALLLPLSPLAVPLGFVALPAEFHFLLLALVMAYLSLVELVKRRLTAMRTRPVAAGCEGGCG